MLLELDIDNIVASRPVQLSLKTKLSLLANFLPLSLSCATPHGCGSSDRWMIGDGGLVYLIGMTHNATELVETDQLPICFFVAEYSNATVQLYGAASSGDCWQNHS